MNKEKFFGEGVVATPPDQTPPDHPPPRPDTLPDHTPDHTPQTRHPPGPDTHPPGTEYTPLGLSTPPGTKYTPPVNRMTNRCKNITLATTSLRLVTRLHSSRMHTACLLPVSPSMHCAGCLPPGGCLVPGSVWSWGVSGPGEVSGRRGCLVLGVCLLPGGVYPSMQWGRPLCEQNDRQVQKYYLAPHFVCVQ